jgi:transcriptional regulator with XRE-family HTH domain
MEGSELRAWRESNGWTLEQAARYLGSTKTSVYRWETGRYTIPTTIHLLATLLADKRNRRSVENILYKHLDT